MSSYLAKDHAGRRGLTPYRTQRAVRAVTGAAKPDAVIHRYVVQYISNRQYFNIEATLPRCQGVR
jgi:hypothetical protein